MSRPRIAIAALGGTIAMASSEPGAPITPALTADDLLGLVPGLDELAEVTAVTLDSAPGASLTPQGVLRAIEWARGCDYDGYVLTQGTDTLEESAFLLDLYWDRQEPLVLTGSMRAPGAAGSDGPANLRAAVVVAGSLSARGLGAVVVINDEVHAAPFVRKADSTSPAAFASTPFGPLGRVSEDVLVLGTCRHRWDPLALPPPSRNPYVPIIESFLGDDGETVHALSARSPDALVVSCLGAGHVSASTADAIGEYAVGGLLIISARTGSGPVLTATYGFPGSETDLARRGAISSGWLDARKARLLTWALLAIDAPREQLRQEMERRGALRWPGRRVDPATLQIEEADG